MKLASTQRRAMRAGCTVGLVVCVTVALSATAGAATPSGAPPGNLLSPLALGLNTAPWDYIYAAGTSAGGGVNTIQPLLRAGASVPDNSEWNNTVLGQDNRYIGFVDAHYYPFYFSGSTGGSNPTDQQVLQSLMSVPALYAQIRGELNAYDPRAQVIVGETGVSNNETTTVCTPAGALFAAGDVLSWLAAGASSVDWWDMNNYGNTGATCTSPDYGMFTSDSPPAPETPTTATCLPHCWPSRTRCWAR
jgi:hypothetical protein